MNFLLTSSCLIQNILYYSNINAPCFIKNPVDIFAFKLLSFTLDITQWPVY